MARGRHGGEGGAAGYGDRPGHLRTPRRAGPHPRRGAHVSGRRYRALLVGNWHYPDDPANLPDLKGPVNDVSGLAQALADPDVGLFAPADITMLTERASHEIAAEMEAFFADASRTDLLFVYYSGHGLTADDGSLLLCGRNARTDRKLATTVSAEPVNPMIPG